MKRAEHSSAFSAFAPAKVKFLVLGSSVPLAGDLFDRVRSLTIEHVSPAFLVQQEISRRTPAGLEAGRAIAHGAPVPDRLQLALVRKWFWARKPDAGFLLTGFPATLLQARVFDEWLEARGETLTAVDPAGLPAADPVVTHYRTQGLLLEALSPAA